MPYYRNDETEVKQVRDTSLRWQTIKLPFACTASVTRFQPSTCSSVKTPATQSIISTVQGQDRRRLTDTRSARCQQTDGTSFGYQQSTRRRSSSVVFNHKIIRYPCLWVNGRGCSLFATSASGSRDVVGRTRLRVIGAKTMRWFSFRAPRCTGLHRLGVSAVAVSKSCPTVFDIASNLRSW